ncbi:hypothetical protein ACU686_32110 [Yinghuangia aomiensis]
MASAQAAEAQDPVGFRGQPQSGDRHAAAFGPHVQGARLDVQAVGFVAGALARDHEDLAAQRRARR